MKPAATIALIAINCIIYLLWQNSLAPRFGLNYLAIGRNEYYRFITCIFMHGSVMHILMNMGGLYSLGTALERRIGSVKFLLLYLSIGVAASAGSLGIRMLMGRANVLSIGASGAIYGLFGIFIGLIWKVAGLQKALSASRQTLIILAAMCFMRGIDNYAHIIGITIGVLIGYSFL